MIHAPVQPFFGNWLYWQACALAHHVGLWLRTLALPRALRRARGKRLRLAFLNVAARLVRHGRRLHLRCAAGVAVAVRTRCRRRQPGGSSVGALRGRPTTAGPTWSARATATTRRSSDTGWPVVGINTNLPTGSPR